MKFPTGGDSPRLPLGTESVEFRYRRSESGWKKKGSRVLVRGKLCYRALMNFHRGFFIERSSTKEMTKQDREYMMRAMALAARGSGWVNPNPMVGAVIVRDGRILGEGWHKRCGDWHAERNALLACTEDPAGATMYVTLEPCCHTGKTPPCTDAILESGIARVVVGLRDPNPKVAGKGIRILEEAGVTVEMAGMEDLLEEQNRVFLHYITTGLPWVVFKTAATLDGKIATRTGNSRWITGEAARAQVHCMRATYPAILVGIGTVLADDPMLDCRLEGAVRQPVRLVADSMARLPLESRLVQTATQFRTVVIHGTAAPQDRLEALRERGVETWGLSTERVEALALAQKVAAAGLDAILLEGGGTLAASFLQADLVREYCLFLAPKVVGGKEAPTSVEGLGLARMADAWQLEQITVDRFGEDLCIRGRLPMKK